MITKIMERLGWIPKERYDSLAYRKKKQLGLMLKTQTVITNNNISLNVPLAYTQWQRDKTTKEIKYSAHTTKKHPTRDEWLKPKYSRRMHEYLQYDDKETEEQYKELARSLFPASEDIKKYTADDNVYFAASKLLIELEPWNTYSRDIVTHDGLTEVWESPKWLMENLWENKTNNRDCDSVALFVHNVLYEVLMLTHPDKAPRLEVQWVKLPTGEYHLLNTWLKEDKKAGCGVIPIESTYFAQEFWQDWQNNRWIQKQRYLLVKGFDRVEEWEWNL